MRSLLRSPGSSGGVERFALLLPCRSGEPVELEGAICLHTLRPLPVGVTVERGQILPLDDPLVTAFPDHFRGLVRIEEVRGGH
jgi:hypothetical protein